MPTRTSCKSSETPRTRGTQGRPDLSPAAPPRGQVSLWRTRAPTRSESSHRLFARETDGRCRTVPRTTRSCATRVEVGLLGAESLGRRPLAVPVVGRHPIDCHQLLRL